MQSGQHASLKTKTDLKTAFNYNCFKSDITLKHNHKNPMQDKHMYLHRVFRVLMFNSCFMAGEYAFYRPSLHSFIRKRHL